MSRSNSVIPYSISQLQVKTGIQNKISFTKIFASLFLLENVILLYHCSTFFRDSDVNVVVQWMNGILFSRKIISNFKTKLSWFKCVYCEHNWSWWNLASNTSLCFRNNVFLQIYDNYNNPFHIRMTLHLWMRTEGLPVKLLSKIHELVIT